MSSERIHRIRNLALVGAAGAGKTSLAERLLLQMKVITSAGSIERGNTVCDFDPLEKEFGHSLEVALCHGEQGGHLFNVLDTPGYADFLGRTLAVLPAVETAVLVINAGNGVERMSERLFSAVRERGLDCFIVINKIDAAGVDCAALLAEIQRRLGKECLPINLPAARATRMRDCYFEPVAGECDFGAVTTAHDALVDQVIELDEALTARYLEQGESLSPAQMHAPFEQALRDGHVVPVCFTSARTGVGIEELLRVLGELAPDPTEGNPPLFLKGAGSQARPITVSMDADRHAVAHVFKIAIDPYVGRIAAVRVHQGRLRVGQSLFAGDARKAFKLGHLLSVQGRQQREIDEAGPGDLVAISKIDELDYDTVIHDSHDEDDHHLKPIALPPALHGLALKASKHGEEQKLSDALHKLAAEDPSLHIEHRAALNETVLLGLGELHLKVALRKIRDRAGIDIETHVPSVAYRETITADAEGHARHKKQTGGAGQFGEVHLRITPLARGAGFEFVDEVVGGAIPGQFLPAVEKGVREVLHTGVIAGYPVHDVRVSVFDGKHHPVDSKEVAFVTAGRKAMLAAVDKARPVVLEPIVRLDIDVGAVFVGDITGELTARRGLVTGTGSGEAGRTLIAALLPLAELPAFQLRLKSLSGGDGSFNMELSHYDAVPPAVQKELVGKYRRKEEES
ncbi:MAG TPA: elongation factor G [Gammaproteobacteria bacterium]|nr:elongation factor G [Gammaproteobacteria bacterium]